MDAHPTILLIEDEPRLRHHLQILLQSAGYGVTTAAHGAEGIKWTQEEPFDLVITDLVMPDMDGFQVMDYLKVHCPETVVVALTGDVSTESAIEALRQGAYDYLCKPLEVDLLHRVVERALEKARLQKALRRCLEEVEVREDATRASEARYRAVMQDATRWREIEEQFLRSEKLAAVGQLAAGVAHELGNVLAIISSTVQGLLSHVDEAHPHLASLEVIRRNVAQADRTIRSLLSFAKPRAPALTPVDVATVLEGICLLFEAERAASHIRVVRRFAPDVPLVMADHEQLQQVFLNLLLNAIQAMPEGGSITLTTTFDPEGNQVKITIADTGSGIAQEDLGRIFEPFFTTKQGGTGLGLCVSDRLIRAHGGSIAVTSSAGKGSVFTISLPAITL